MGTLSDGRGVLQLFRRTTIIACEISELRSVTLGGCDQTQGPADLTTRFGTLVDGSYDSPFNRQIERSISVGGLETRFGIVGHMWANPLGIDDAVHRPTCAPTERPPLGYDTIRRVSPEFLKTFQPTFRYIVLKADFFPNQRGWRVLPTGYSMSETDRPDSISQIAAILARGFLRYRKSRRFHVGETPQKELAFVPETRRHVTVVNDQRTDGN